MIPVSDLPLDIQARISGRDLIVFDGECVLCSKFFQFVLKRDRTETFLFATAQSELGQGLYAALELPKEDFETILVVVDGKLFQRLDAICVATRRFGVFFRIAYFARFLPKRIKDAIYFAVARRRYRIFGRAETCLVPSGEFQSRFIA